MSGGQRPAGEQGELSETLDPEDWDEVRRIGRAMVDDMVDYLATVRERPAWRSMPTEAKDALAEPPPMQGAPLSSVYDTFRSHILPYPTGNIHPRFFGWVMGTGTATGMLADMLASGMNAHVAGYDQAASTLERQVLAWLAELMGFPTDASGVLVSGATMANLNALAVARNEKAGFDVRDTGVQGADAPRLTVYGSAETHGWVYKACELMGLGRRAFRAVPVDAQFQIDVDACRAMIAEDLTDGARPICLIANVGTVNTGAIDDVAALRVLADEFGVWLHVDGAFGSLAALSPTAKALVEAQSRADSIAFDLHKWGYMPYEVGCVLVRRPEAHVSTFAQAPSYLTSSRRGLSVETTYFADRGLQLSRGFRALKVWMSLKEQGVEKIGRLIQQNIDQAKYLERLIGAHCEFELMAPVPLNTVCFRFAPAGVAEEQLDSLNEEIVMRLHESGDAVPSHTHLGGRYAIRACITNHRSRGADFDRLVGDVAAHGRAALVDLGFDRPAAGG